MIHRKRAFAAWDKILGASRSSSFVPLGCVTALTMLAPIALHAQAAGQFFELPNAAAPQRAPDSQVPAKIEGGFRDSSADIANRVVGGRPVSLTDWPSYVLVRYLYRAENKVGTCGGTVIAPDWVLTAAHCASGKTADNFVVVEGTDNVNNKGREIGVSEVIVHESYSDTPAPHDDVALLHLKTPARAQVQTLLAGAPPANSPMASVAGFGLTKPQPVEGPHDGPLSNQLLQVDLPVVARAACVQILSKHYGNAIARVVDEATVCAGDPVGGKDSCNGDSGGPLAINAASRRVQIGVVSWGPGCAQKDTVGVYASVGYFEAWIKRHVPGATFYSLATAPTSNPNPGPSTPSSAIAEIEQVAAAIGSGTGVRVDLIEGNRARVGGIIHFHVASPIAGQLVVYNIDLAAGTAYQVFPNRYSGGNQPGATKLQVAAGADIQVPNVADRFDIRVKEPVGKNRLYAFVLPASVKIDDLAEKGMDMRDLADPQAFFHELADRALRGVEVAPRADRGVAMYEYDIVR